MDEEKTITETEPEVTTPSEDAGNKPATTSLITRADLAAERLEKALRQERENLKMREALMVRDSLGGEGGGAQISVKKEVDAEQYAKDVLEGKITNGKE